MRDLLREPKVVIAGMGAISAAGCGVEPLLAALQNNSSGLRPTKKFDSPRFQSNIVGAIPESWWWGERSREPFLSQGWPSAACEDAHPTDDPAWVLASEALTQAQIAAQEILAPIPPERIGLILSTTKANIHALELISENRPCSESARRHLQPDLLAEDLAKKFGARGKTQTVSLACVSGLAAIVQGARLIQRGDVDAVFVVGVDCLSEFVVAGFTTLKAIDPLGCRPFDVARGGLSPGEAGAAIVLVGQASCLSDCADRQDACATIQIRAFGSSNDANHLTGPSRDGSGLAQAIRVAFNIAKISPDEIDFVHAHGTGTPYNDAMESLALKMIFGDTCPPVSGVKGMLGHTLGAAGVIETVVCTLAMQREFLPGTPRLNSPAAGVPTSFLREPKSGVKLKNVLKLNTGFGGVNGALILSHE